MKPHLCQSRARHAAAVLLAPVVVILFAAPYARAQYANSQYIQQAPNYVTYPQAKPSPYGYAPQPGQQTYSQPQPYAPQYPQQPQQYAPQPQYADPGYANPAYSDPGQNAEQYAPQPDQYPPDQYQQDQSQQPPYAQQPGAAPQPLAADQLAQLLAPIALYPDALVAQVLAAATYPAQVVAADNWLHAQGYAPPEQIAYAADAQANWDPSVKALTAFPQVLDLMNHDLGWTTDLGNAYYNQPQDVLQTIQVLRQRAEDAGTLQNTPQETVSYNQGYIQLAPTNPQVVYVPAYNPWAVYGQPVTPYPGFSLWGSLASLVGDVAGGFGRGGFGGGYGGGIGGGLGGGALRFGLGVALSAFSHTPFGWAGWALNWLTSSIFFHQSPYYSNSTSVAHWAGGRGGSYYAGGHSYGGGYGNGYARNGSGYDRQPSYNRFGNGAAGPTFTRPPVRTAENPAYGRGFDGENRGYAAARPATPGYAFGRQQAEPARPQSFARPAYGNGFYSNQQRAYGARPAAPFNDYAGRNSMPAYGNQFAQQRSYAQPRSYAEPRAYAEQRSYGGNRGFAESYAKPEKSGGFHMFGGGHSEPSYHASYKASKMAKAPKAPKMSHGGGHHGGGGGVFGHHGGH